MTLPLESPITPDQSPRVSDPVAAATLIDRFGRQIEYLRLSVTDRCDLRCQYCLPEGFRDFDVPDDWLDFDEIERVIRVFIRLGTRRIRLTGGEPLVRKGLADLARRLATIPGLDDLSLSTNATRMSREASRLFEAGIRRINVSLDTLDVDTFKRITGGKLEKVLAGLDAAREAGFAPIKINTVVMGGINDHDIDRLVDYCGRQGFTLRLIETMPIGDTGRAATGAYVPLSTVRERLERRFKLIPTVMAGGGPARYVKVDGSDLVLGFITPISQHFCDTCNRVRLGADGTLYTCLGNEHNVSLRAVLRGGLGGEALDQALENAIREAIARKPQRHEFNDRPGKIVRFMAQTGG
ncbi:MAG: GTP 3',8-cyclase MoaA [Thioalkalivibrionaceae bacterium]